MLPGADIERSCAPPRRRDVGLGGYHAGLLGEAHAGSIVGRERAPGHRADQSRPKKLT
jgi:hypothetical protein